MHPQLGFAVFPVEPFPNARAAAFLLSPSTAVTALHAVRRASPPKVANRKSTIYRTCTHADLAILSLPDGFSDSYAVTTTLTKPSSTDSHTIHPPDSPPIAASLLRIDTPLIVYSGACVPALTFSCRAPIPRGWSGSPVLDQFSRVVGVLIQSHGQQCHVIPSHIIAHVHNSPLSDVQIGYITNSEWQKTLRDGDTIHSVNGHALSSDGCIDWGMPAPIHAAVFDAPKQQVDVAITRSGADQLVKLNVGIADQAAAICGRRGVCVVAGEYVMETVSVELLEMRYGARWAGAELVTDVVYEGDEVVVFVRDAGEKLVFEKVECVDGRPVTGLEDVVEGGIIEVAGRAVAVPKGVVRACFVNQW